MIESATVNMGNSFRDRERASETSAVREGAISDRCKRRWQSQSAGFMDLFNKSSGPYLRNRFSPDFVGDNDVSSGAIVSCDDDSGSVV